MERRLEKVLEKREREIINTYLLGLVSGVILYSSSLSGVLVGVLIGYSWSRKDYDFSYILDYIKSYRF